MLTLQEISIRYRVSLRTLRRMAEDDDIIFDAPEADSFSDPVLDAAMNVARRGGYSAFYFAVLARLMIDGRRQEIARIEAARPLGKDGEPSAKSLEAAAIFSDLDWPSVFDFPLPDAEKITLGVAQRDESARQIMSAWLKAIIEKAARPVGYYYVAARLVASFPWAEMPARTKQISQPINYLVSGKNPIMQEWCEGAGKSRVFRVPNFDL